MNEQSAAADHGIATESINRPVVLRGKRLFIARAVWIALAVGIFIITVALVSRFRSILLVGDEVSRSFNALQQVIPYATLSRLVQWGRYAVLAVYNLTALLIFWRKSDELMGLITSLLLLTLPFWFDLGGSIPDDCCDPTSPLGWVWLTAILGFVLAIVFLNIFPSGRFPAGWAKRLFRLGFAVLFTVIITNTVFGGRVEGWLWPVSIIATIGLLGLGAISQVYRYRHISGPVERQQTRWVVASLALVIFWLFAVYTQSPFRSWSVWAGPWALLQIFGTLTVVALLPLSIARAILRYHLWDIDVIVRKTLVYSLVTGFLILVYFISIVLLQSLFSRVTGQDSTLATILSTLLIAALFLPLRRRIQHVIDRRFYRRKYDAQKTLEQFAHTVRDETDLEKLTAELLRVIQETMEPEHVSIWLKPIDDHRPMTADIQEPAKTSALHRR